MNQTQTNINSSTTRSIVNVAAYKFVALDELPERRAELKELTARLNLRGTILLSPEGINMFLSGEREPIDEFLQTLRRESAFSNLETKESYTDYQPFNRMLVRLKKEIIAFGVEGIDPIGKPAPKLAPAELKRWLDEGRPVTLLDTRNDYEIEVGTFENAVTLGIGHFREFPEATKMLPAELKQQPIVMFCTGGIRCEKAGPFMENQGFEQIYQLEGGILKYFEECGGAHWDGECFVFDQRVAVDPHLTETDTTQCYACLTPLSVEDQQSEHYIPGEVCPYCYVAPEYRLQARIALRQHRIRELTTPLPGSIPYVNRRPLHVPQAYDRATLLDFLDGLHPHIGREEWLRRCEAGLIVLGDHPVYASRIVRAGEQFDHRIPDTIEPDVNAAIRVLYEDEFIVVIDKPAPLPMHPSGRFNKNTLQSILCGVYQPQRLRPVHRLDANTSGVVIFARTRAVARQIQPQFESRDVEKVYLARVQGHPEQDEFRSDRPIGQETEQAGLRLPCEEGLSASTEFRVLERFPDGTALVEARPLTGRTNQIRIHLWDQGHPICGDPAYLPNQKLGETQTLKPTDPPLCLHAWKISFSHPKGERMDFVAEQPAWS